MIVSSNVIAPNSVVFVISAAEPEVSTEMQGAVAATPTCVSVGTLSEMDGPTEVVLADEDVDVAGLVQLYSGRMDTELGRVAVQTVDGEQLGEVAAGGATTAIAVWGSDPHEPDRVVIRIG